jgi:alanine racemase
VPAVKPEARLSRLRAAWARVDLERLRENYRAVAGFSSVPLMPVVKADAYGHGAVAMARAFEALAPPMLAVAYPEEGAALRAAGVRLPIVLLSPFGRGQGPMVVEQNLTPVITTPGNLEEILAVARTAGRRLPVHVKIDTGMNRLGFDGPGFVAAARRLADSGRIEVEGAMTHLASADEDRRATTAQLDRFDAALEALAAAGIRPPWVHAVNSAGLLELRPTHTVARCGLLLFGLRPRPIAPELPVRPVMTVSASLARVVEVPAGTPVSYGGRWVARRDSRIGTLPIGYADGVPRTEAMRERGYLAVRGRPAPVTGSVCMDLTMVDLTDHPEVGDSEEAVLFGDSPTAWDVADWAGTTAWQVLTAVGARVPRVYVEDGRVVEVDSPYL